MRDKSLYNQSPFHCIVDNSLAFIKLAALLITCIKIGIFSLPLNEVVDELRI